MWILERPGEPESDRQTFRVSPGDIKTIGRVPGADFVLDAPLVSRLHCRLTASATTLEIADLASTNGTFVNDRRIKRAVLAPGDRVGLGRVTLVVTLEGGRREARGGS